MRANIWYNGLQGWMLQSGFEILGAYKTLKGARIAARKYGLVLPKQNNGA